MSPTDPQGQSAPRRASTNRCRLGYGPSAMGRVNTSCSLGQHGQARPGHQPGERLGGEARHRTGCPMKLDVLHVQRHGGQRDQAAGPRPHGPASPRPPPVRRESSATASRRTRRRTSVRQRCLPDVRRAGAWRRAPAGRPGRPLGRRPGPAPGDRPRPGSARWAVRCHCPIQHPAAWRQQLRPSRSSDTRCGAGPGEERARSCTPAPRVEHHGGRWPTVLLGHVRLLLSSSAAPRAACRGPPFARGGRRTAGARMCLPS